MKVEIEDAELARLLEVERAAREVDIAFREYGRKSPQCHCALLALQESLCYPALSIGEKEGGQ